MEEITRLGDERESVLEDEKKEKKEEYSFHYISQFEEKEEEEPERDNLLILQDNEEEAGGPKRRPYENMPAIEERFGANLYLASVERETLGGEGTPEYSLLRDKMKNYCGKEHFDERATKELFAASWNYLRKKDTTPWTPEGKRRVSAAAKVMAQTAVDLLQTTADPEERKEITEKIKIEALRSRVFREALMENLPEIIAEKKQGAEEALDAAVFVGEVNSHCNWKKIDAWIPGKMEDNDCERYKTASIRIAAIGKMPQTEKIKNRMRNAEPDTIRYELRAGVQRLEAPERTSSVSMNGPEAGGGMVK